MVKNDLKVFFMRIKAFKIFRFSGFLICCIRLVIITISKQRKVLVKKIKKMFHVKHICKLLIFNEKKK